MQVDCRGSQCEARAGFEHYAQHLLSSKNEIYTCMQRWSDAFRWAEDPSIRLGRVLLADSGATAASGVWEYCSSGSGACLGCHLQLICCLIKGSDTLLCHFHDLLLPCTAFVKLSLACRQLASISVMKLRKESHQCLCPPVCQQQYASCHNHTDVIHAHPYQGCHMPARLAKPTGNAVMLYTY